MCRASGGGGRVKKRELNLGEFSVTLIRVGSLFTEKICLANVGGSVSCFPEAFPSNGTPEGMLYELTLQVCKCEIPVSRQAWRWCVSTEMSHCGSCLGFRWRHPPYVSPSFQATLPSCPFLLRDWLKCLHAAYRKLVFISDLALSCS